MANELEINTDWTDILSQFGAMVLSFFDRVILPLKGKVCFLDTTLAYISGEIPDIVNTNVSIRFG